MLADGGFDLIPISAVVPDVLALGEEHGEGQLRRGANCVGPPAKIEGRRRGARETDQFKGAFRDSVKMIQADLER